MQRRIISHNFRTGKSQLFNEIISTTRRHEILQQQCPSIVTDTKVRYPSAMCSIIALILLLIFYPYDRMNYCKRDPQHASCITDGSTSEQVYWWYLLFPPIFLIYMALPSIGILELLASIIIICGSIFGLVWIILWSLLRTRSSYYEQELAARYVDHLNGANLSEYLYNIIDTMSNISEIDKVWISDEGIHVSPPYPLLSQSTKGKLWYFDHIVQDHHQ